MIKEFITPAVLIALLVLLLEPFGFMPPIAVMTVLALATATFVFFSIFLWREKGADEREESHIQKADRFGFIFGALVLVVAIVVQSFARMLSPWLVVALVAMIAAKAIAIAYQ